MSERWPAAMLLRTAAEYLDTSVTSVEKLVRAGELGCVQFDDRGDRRILREEIDAYLYRLQKRAVTGRKTA